MAPVTSEEKIPRFRLGLLLWSAGMLGAAVMTLTVLPQLARGLTLPAPSWLISLAGIAQSAVLLALAAWIGCSTAPPVGLHAFAFEAAVSARPITPALRRQILPALAVGVPGGLLLFVVTHNTPPALAKIAERFDPPLAARLLYGGFTEELLLRWGFLSAVAWLTWRFLQGRRGAPRSGTFWFAIAASALLFGVGHLPGASVLVGSLSADVVVFVVGANSVFGLLFGWLFWRFGLESAMIAHALAHAVNYLASLRGAP